jgi:subtilisin family serine protease
VADYLRGVAKCRDRNATVVNLSISGLDSATATELAQLENRIVDIRRNWGINVVAAAGNTAGPVGYPARFPTAVAVGASDSAGAFCQFSSRGQEIDLMTLGCGVQLSWPGGGLAIGNGTSYSAPVVSGILAALRSYVPAMSAETAETILAASATATSSGMKVDAAAAFRLAGLSGMLESGGGGPPSAVAAPVETAPAKPAVSDPMRELGVGLPRVRDAIYSKGVLSVRTSAMPDFARAVFRVDGRSFTRASGLLRVRLRTAPRRVTVAYVVPMVGTTQTVRVVVRTRRPLLRATMKLKVRS